MSLDYTKFTVGEIKDMLVTEGRHTYDELDNMPDIKGKSMWVTLHKDYDAADTEEEVDFSFGDLGDTLNSLIDDAAPMVHDEVEKDMPPVIPAYDSPEWNDYVLNQFTPDEMVDGKYPKVNGLRRVAELLLGDVVCSGPIRVEQTMDPTHTGKAVVTYQVTIDWKLDQYYGTTSIDINAELPQRIFSSVASSWVGNTDNDYASFPEAIAETRAEGRALRRALRINTVCADELTKKDTAATVEQQQSSVDTTGEWDEEALITDQQITLITTMCDRLKIDVTKFINNGSLQYESINDIKKGNAGNMFSELNRFQSSGGDSKEIPTHLKIGE